MSNLVGTNSLHITSGFILTVFLLLAVTIVASSTFYMSKALATGGDHIYVMGGFDGSGNVNTVQVYDPSTNTWSTTSAGTLPTAVIGSSSVVYNNKIYVMGGDIGGATRTNTVQVYDPSTNTWSTTSAGTLPTAVIGSSSVVYNNKIYVMGGDTGVGAVSNTVQVYDPSTNTWSTTSAGTLPIEVNAPAVAVLQDKIYVIGGGISTGITNTVQVYDPSTNTWSTTSVAPLPIGVVNAPAVVYNNQIYVMGGYTGGPGPIASTNTVQVYDPSTNTWSTTSAEPIPNIVTDAVAVISNNEIYVMGGFTDPGAVPANAIEVYDPATNTWSTTSAGTLPTAVYLASAAVISSPSQSLTVTSVTSSLNPSQLGQSVTFIAQVSTNNVGASPQLSGSVTFFDNGNPITGSIDIPITPISSSEITGSASFTTSLLSIGSHQITASYSNDPNYLTSISSQITQVVDPAPILSVPSDTGAGTVTFSSSQGGFSSLSAVPQTSLPSQPPPGSYPFGFFTWTVTGVPIGSSSTITLDYPTDPGTVYEKLIGTTWYPITVSRTSNPDGSVRITMTLTDGVVGQDSDQSANGIISDPGAMVLVTPAKVTGEGHVGKSIGFQLEAKSLMGGQAKGELDFHDKDAKINLHSTKMTFLSTDSSMTKATLQGNAKVNQKDGFSFQADVSDPDKTGNHDALSITISNSTGKVVYHNSGTIKGHIEIKSGKNNDNHHDKNFK